MKYYQIKAPRKISLTRPSAPHTPRLDETVFYTKQVQGKRASKAEENLARLLERNDIDFVFRYVIPVYGEIAMGLLGEVECDFLITSGRLRPVSVKDTAFIHANYEQMQRDANNEARINEYFMNFGAEPIVSITALELDTPGSTEYAARKYGLI